MLRSGRYEQKEAAQLGKIIEVGEVILEVGAGIGFISSVASLNPNTVRIETYEANPELKNLIETVHRINQIDKATVHTGVLMHHPAEKTRPFYIRPDFWASSLSPGSGQTRKVDVPVFDFNTTLRRIRPTMIICDIEGGELDLFEHAELDGVTKILMEIHQNVLGRAGIKRLFDHLSAKGFHYDQDHSFGQVVLFSHVGRSLSVREKKNDAPPPAGNPPAGKPVATKWSHPLGTRPASKKYHLHLGAHQTSNDFIRRSIALHRDALLAQGIDFWDLETTRAKLTSPLQALEKMRRDGSDGGAAAPAPMSLALPENTKRIVISDESLVGRVPVIFRNGCYRGNRKRMQVVHKALGNDVKAFFTIRNTADFFLAAYWATISARGYVSFDGFLENSQAMEFSWLPIFEDLVAVFGRQNVVIFEFDSVLFHPSAVITRLTGSDVELSVNERNAIYQPSVRAVEYIGIEQEWKSSRAPFEVARMAKARFPVGDGYEVFAPLTSAQRAALESNYQNDLKQIHVWVPGAD